MSVSKRNRQLILGLIIPAVLTCAVGLLVLARREPSSPPLTVAQSATANPASANPLSSSELFKQRYGYQLGRSNEAEVSHATRGKLTLRFRAIGLNRQTSDVTADQTLAQEVLKQIQGSPLFDQTTDFSGKLSDEESPGTFTFTIAARVKRPQEL